MSSEDDYYLDRYDYRYDRRSSKRPRRRASSPRRHRTRDCDYFPRKNRRTKPIYNQHAPRLAGAIILLVLIVYEAVVLRAPASSKYTPSTQTTSAHVNTFSRPTSPSHVSPSHQEPASHAPPTAPSSTSSTQASKSSTPPSQNNQLPASPPEKRETAPSVALNPHSSSASPTPKPPNSPATNHAPTALKTEPHHLPDAAIQLEAKAADEDPDIDPRSVRKRTDKNRLSKSTDSGDKGADPGAGENFWNWFQETKGSDTKNVSKSIPCPEENTRVCQMFYKYIRKYKIRTIFDVSCEKNFEWMGGILKKAGNELWGFKYYCSLWSGERAGDTRSKLGGLPFVEFDDAKWWRAGFADDTELLFAWDTLAHLAYGRVWNFFVKARKQNVKYILVDNYPGILNDPSPKRDYLNLRKHPFRFPSAKEVAQNVTEPGETAKRQLLFYETSMLPDNLQ